MRRKQRSLVKRRPGSPTCYGTFTIHGHRFRRSLKTDDPETAEIPTQKIRSGALLGKLTGKRRELTLTQALTLLARAWAIAKEGEQTGDPFRCSDLPRTRQAHRQVPRLNVLVGETVAIADLADPSTPLNGRFKRPNLDKLAQMGRPSVTNRRRSGTASPIAIVN